MFLRFCRLAGVFMLVVSVLSSSADLRIVPSNPSPRSGAERDAMSAEIIGKFRAFDALTDENARLLGEVRDEVGRRGGTVISAETAAVIPGSVKSRYEALVAHVGLWNTAYMAIRERREAEARERERIERERADEEARQRAAARARLDGVSRGVAHALGASESAEEPEGVGVALPPDPLLPEADVAAAAPLPVDSPARMARVAGAMGRVARLARRARAAASPLRTAEGEEDPQHRLRRLPLEAAATVDQELTAAFIVFHDYAQLTLKRILERYGQTPDNLSRVHENPFFVAARTVTLVNRAFEAVERLRDIRSEIVMTPDITARIASDSFAEIQGLLERARELHELNKLLLRVKQVYWDGHLFLRHGFGTGGPTRAEEQALLDAGRGDALTVLRPLRETRGVAIDSPDLSADDKTRLYGGFLEMMSRLKRVYVNPGALPKAIKIRLGAAVTPEALLAAVESYRQMYESLRQKYVQALLDTSGLLSATSTPPPEHPNLPEMMAELAQKLQVPRGIFTRSRQYERVQDARRELVTDGAARREEASLESVAQQIREATAALRGGVMLVPSEEDDVGPLRDADARGREIRRDLGPALDAAGPGGAAAAAAVPLPH